MNQAGSVSIWGGTEATLLGRLVQWHGGAIAGAWATIGWLLVAAAENAEPALARLVVGLLIVGTPLAALRFRMGGTTAALMLATVLVSALPFLCGLPAVFGVVIALAVTVIFAVWLDRTLVRPYAWFQRAATDAGERESGTGVPDRLGARPLGWRDAAVSVARSSMTQREAQIAGPVIARRLGFDVCRVVETRRALEFQFYTQRRELTDPYQGTLPLAPAEGLVSMPIAADELDRPVSITLKQTAGLLVAGSPGSGKSAALLTFIAGLYNTGCVDLVVIDGKGETSFDPVKQVAWRYNNSGEMGDKDIVRILEDVDKLRMSRANDGDFWDNGGPTPENRLCVVVLDEAQTWTELAGAEKEDVATAKAIMRLASKLVAKGRSSGIFLAFATQKPTVDQVPSIIRSKLDLRVCFRVNDEETEKAALGGQTVPTLTAVGAPQGIGLFLTGSGDPVRGKAYYCSPEDVARSVTASS